MTERLRPVLARNARHTTLQLVTWTVTFIFIFSLTSSSRIRVLKNKLGIVVRRNFYYCAVGQIEKNQNTKTKTSIDLGTQLATEELSINLFQECYCLPL